LSYVVTLLPCYDSSLIEIANIVLQIDSGIYSQSFPATLDVQDESSHRHAPTLLEKMRKIMFQLA
jgi:hypothetical protein